MAKPTENLGWAENGTASDIQEPTAGQRASGIAEGGSWTRKRLNWMFNAAGKLSDWVKTYAMDSSENLNDVANKDTSRTNLEVLKAGTGTSEARTNSQNDTEFVAHDEVVNALTSNSTSNPLSANQGKELKDQLDTTESTANAALEEGTGSSQGRDNNQNDSRFVQGVAGTANDSIQTNAQNAAEFLQEGNNLSDLTNASTARGNLGSDNAANLTSGTVPEGRLTTSTTSVKGITQLNNSVTSTSTSTAATASSAKTAYDRGTTGVNDASSAQSTANSAQSTANAALVEGTSGSQGRTNSQNDGRFSTPSDLAAKSQVATVSAATLGGNSGELVFTREGNIITVNGFINHDSQGGFIAYSGVPAWAVPPLHTATAVYGATSTGVDLVYITNVGYFVTSYIDWTGGGYTKESTDTLSLTYSVAP
jgi:hypothetical protein